MISHGVSRRKTLLRRYVPGPGMDETVAWYEGSGTGDRRWLIADALGSTVAVTNASGAALQLNAYDEWGAPASSNLGRFQYTGQAWLPELGLYHYKARAYAPAIGRFMQPDPILWTGGMNLYAYVGNDPLNGADPWGYDEDPVVVTAKRRERETYWAFNVVGPIWDPSRFLPMVTGPEGSADIFLDFPQPTPTEEDKKKRQCEGLAHQADVLIGMMQQSVNNVGMVEAGKAGIFAGQVGTGVGAATGGGQAGGRIVGGMFAEEIIGQVTVTSPLDQAGRSFGANVTALRKSLQDNLSQREKAGCPTR